ncbi:uncharacterized protein CANTADRAFT_25488 [Suhomyces tanzawaensis NRRL Y-17324]|uniref:Uncharacterized protein n=1 Tax=Suhomyces tanzawaensis NRRL Y-17324 TaxID=984487 RepID=A0A1E4SP74_9ASCO|nr:uncharacterized protein CANTADRAFT_25488 [Suhomyces tanzawaensis NRRL Y-17324]ODV81296.1 hypothetical protein CANTADRAFT_25488 [Suhomyces tanzawaensis NRRL Y-17324]
MLSLTISYYKNGPGTAVAPQMHPTTAMRGGVATTSSAVRAFSTGTCKSAPLCLPPF